MDADGNEHLENQTVEPEPREEPDDEAVPIEAENIDPQQPEAEKEDKELENIEPVPLESMPSTTRSLPARAFLTEMTTQSLPVRNFVRENTIIKTKKAAAKSTTEGPGLLRLRREKTLANIYGHLKPKVKVHRTPFQPKITTNYDNSPYATGGSIRLYAKRPTLGEAGKVKKKQSNAKS